MIINTASVIVTCHNLERYIGEAIESVLSQDYTGPIELIVVDDASTDKSADIIGEYGSAICLSTKENLGVLMATVLGLRKASGELVFFLDGDDIWHPEKLRLCIARFEADPSLCLLTHDLEYIDSGGRQLGINSVPGQRFGNREVDGECIRMGILEHGDYVWLGSAYAVRSSLIDAKGFCDWAERLPDPFNTYQDWPLAFWAASRPGAELGHLPAKLFRYRLHASNYSGDASTLEKARRNLRRSYNTMAAILDIARSSLVAKPVVEITRQHLAYRSFLLQLYQGKRASTLRSFLSAQKYLYYSTFSLPREWARFIGIQLLGPGLFLRLTSLRRRPG